MVGKFLVCALIFRWSGAVLISITAPNGRWCGYIGGGGICGNLGRGAGAGTRGWICPADVVGWDSGG